MKKADRIRLLLFGVAALATFSTSSAWAVLCGDTTGPPVGTDTPCDCGDTVTTNTTLSKSDPVIRRVCPPPVALFVDKNVRLDAHSAIIRCDSSPGFTTGIEIIGDGVHIVRGIIRGCDDGIFGITSGSTIERVTARDSDIGFLLIGDNNALLSNLCHDNTLGIAIVGDGNTLERNYCHGNAEVGIFVAGSFNQLNHNQGRSNGARWGVLAIGGNNGSDFRNYAAGNGAPFGFPQCEIDAQTVNGAYC